MKVLIIILFLTASFLYSNNKVCINPSKIKATAFLIEFIHNRLYYNPEPFVNHVTIDLQLCGETTCYRNDIYSYFKNNAVKTIYYLSFNDTSIRKESVLYFVFDAETGIFLGFYNQRLAKVKIRRLYNDFTESLEDDCNKFVD